MKGAMIAILLGFLFPGLVSAQDANTTGSDETVQDGRNSEGGDDTTVPTLSDLAGPGATSPTWSPDSTTSSSSSDQTGAEAPGTTEDGGNATTAPSSGTAEDGATTNEDGSASGAGAEQQPAAAYGTRDKLVLYDIPDRFEGPKKYTLSMMGGLTRFDALDAIMASSNGVQDYFAYAPSFRFQVGRQFADQVQLQIEVGFARYRGFALAEDGTPSGDVIEAKAFPGSLSLSYRFDYLDEQAVVPYFGAGLSGVAGTFSDFEESVGSSATTDTTSSDDSGSDTTTDTTDSTSTTAVTLGSIGTRFGAYLGFGLEFLLDVFEPERASDLELSSGINDSYLVFDIRYYWLDRYFQDATLQKDPDNILYNGLQFTAGLKFDF